MKALKQWSLVLAMVLVQATAWAQLPNFSGKDDLTNEADFSLKLSKTSDFKVGDVIELKFTGHVREEGWHLYSSRKDNNPAYNPTEFVIFEDEGKGLELVGGMTENKKPREKEDDLMGGFIRDFKEHDVTFTQKVKITAEDVDAIGELAAQVCTDAGMCKFLKLELTWKMKAAPAGGAAVTPENGGEKPGDVEVVETPKAKRNTEWTFKPYDDTQSLNANIGMQDLDFAEEISMKPAGLNAFYNHFQAIAYAKEVAKPVLMYFTGHFASSVVGREEKIFEEPAIKAILENQLIMTCLLSDEIAKIEPELQTSQGNKVKTVGAMVIDYQKSKFQTISQPYFALMDESGNTYGEPFGYTPKADDFQGKLESALAAYHEAKGTSPVALTPPKADTAATDSASKGAVVSDAEGEGGCSVSGLWTTFIVAFLAGLIAILTPCVFPMIPMTISFFMKSGEGADRREGMRSGLIYALSIVSIYALAGLLISLLFGKDALYILGSHPIPNFIFFAIFLIFALSFFGLFEITLPSSWSTSMNNKASKGGFLGPFFMAMTLVIVSFSCTGPILGGVVVQAATGSSACGWTPFMGFLGFGVAFGIPFGMLALFPQLLSKLPMAGGWMNTVKVVFGFLELALCMKFLSNVDLVLHTHLLDRQVFIGIWIVIFTLLGFYFLGKILFAYDEPVERISVPRLFFAIATFSFVMYLVPGLWGAPLPILEGLVPPHNEEMGVKLLPHQRVDLGENVNTEICKTPRKYEDILGDHKPQGLCSFYDLDEALAFAKQKNLPLFVDFTGHSCANCRKMENGAWANDKIHSLLAEEFVMVSLFADENHKFPKPLISPNGDKLRTIGNWVTDYQARNYKKISQPYYVLMDHDGSSLNEPVGYTIDIATYEKFLQEGIDVFNKRHGKSGEADAGH